MSAKSRLAQQRVNHQVRAKVFQEREDELSGIGAAGGHNQEDDRDDQARKHLEVNFPFGGQPEIAFLRNLGEVVDEADGCKGQQRKNGQQHKFISQVGPQNCRYQGGQYDQHATHRWSAGLFLMVLRAFLANILADLQLAQLADQPRSENQRQEHGGETRVNRPYRDIAKYVERAEIFLQEVVEHLVARLLCAGEFRRVDSEQALYDAFHLYTARSLNQQQIPGRDKISEKLRSLFRRGEDFGLRARDASSHRSFHNLRRVALHAQDPINLSGLRRKLARFAMKLRRSRAKFAHFPSRKNSTPIVGSRRKHRSHCVQGRRARVVTVIDQCRSIRKAQQFPAHRLRMQRTKDTRSEERRVGKE